MVHRSQDQNLLRNVVKMHIPHSSLRYPTALNELPSDFSMLNFGDLLPDLLPPPGLKFEHPGALQGLLSPA